MSTAEAGFDNGSFTVGVPAFNEEQSIAGVIRSALSDRRCAEVIVADDLSTDRTVAIVKSLQREDGRVRLLVANSRAGQLHGWMRIARAATKDVIVFIDADASPMPDALSLLADTIRDKNVLASGRVVPLRSRPFAAGYFSARVLGRIRRRPGAVEAVIGRFFAVRRNWFVEAVTRDDMLANDAYIASLAANSGHPARYVEGACAMYHAPANLRDFAAQRLRADAGRQQLRDAGFTAGLDRSRLRDVFDIVIAGMQAPLDGMAWASVQLCSAMRRDLAAHGGAASGTWDTQASTKLPFSSHP